MEGFTVASAVTAGLGIFTSVLDVIVGNPLFLAIIGVGLVPLGFKIFRSAKGAAKS